MITDSFQTDLKFLHNKMVKKEPFAFSKYADGEYLVLRNMHLTNCDGWTFVPSLHNKERDYLLQSFRYNHSDYYVGISCPCCQPKDAVNWMRNNVGSSNVTWANLFVNVNYQTFKELFIPTFDQWNKDVILVANSKMDIESLPFKVTDFMPIEIGHWLNPFLENIIEQLSEKATETDGQLFLFSGGPLGNILSHQLHLLNPKNFYLDIGSTINPWGVGMNRDYLLQKTDAQKVCVW